MYILFHFIEFFQRKPEKEISILLHINVTFVLHNIMYFSPMTIV